MAQSVVQHLDFGGVSRIQNLPAPAAATDAATKGYVDVTVEGLAWKDDVKVATSSNITLATPGTTLDGVTMVVNDRVLVLGQTNQPDNGIYIYNGSSTPLTRSYDAQAGSDLLSAVVSVDQGTSGGSTFRQTSTGITLGTTNVVFSAFGTSSPPASTSTAGIAAIATQAEVNTGTVTNKIVTPQTLAGSTTFPRKYASTFGDGSSTSYTITHNLNTQDVVVEVYRASGSYDRLLCEVDHTSSNSITLVFSAAPASNAFKVVVIG